MQPDLFNRRRFVTGILAGGAGALLPITVLGENRHRKESTFDHPKISDVSVVRLKGTRTRSTQAWQSQVQPLHIYREHQPETYVAEVNPGTSSTTYHANYLIISTDDGIEGIYGPVDTEAAVVVDRQIKGFLLGKNPLAGEELWDQMYRLNRHARSGHFMMGISAVDNALWDLRGKYFNVPVYELLGSAGRREVSCLPSGC